MLEYIKIVWYYASYQAPSLRDVDEIYVAVVFYSASIGNSLPTFQDNLHLQGIYCLLKMGPIDCPVTSVRYYHSTMHNIPEQRIYNLIFIQLNEIDFHLYSAASEG
jgi:hypothetical protein